MSDDEYTNLDLETAEGLLYAAGKPELAKALHHHAHGVRNLVQGEWGRSFVNSLDDILGKHVTVLSEQIGGLKTGQTDLQAEFHTGLSTLLETVDGLQASMIESVEDRKAIRNELAMVKEQITTYIAGSRRDEVVKRLNALETEALSTLNARLSALEENNEQLSAIREELSLLSARIGGALPTEADQEVSAQLRVDEAERHGNGG